MPRSFWQKFIVCFLASLSASHTVVRIGWRFLNRYIPDRPVLAIGLLILITGLVYPFIWHRKKDPVRDERIYSYWIGMIRYSIALDLIMVGLQKWFYLQFNTPIAKLDLPLSSFSPEELTWAFFGYSRGFILVIGSLQIGGSLLLLFHRTRLLGATMLIPVMLNITLMDLFYKFHFGEWFSALLILSALVYLLLLDYEKLVETFFRKANACPTRVFKSRLLKNGVRFSAVLIPLAMIGIDPISYKHDWFSGKYKIEQVSINGRFLTAGSCTDSVLSTIYFDQANECVFEFNSLDRRWFGTYRYDEGKDQLTVIWHYPKNIHDTLRASLSRPGAGSGLTLSGRMGSESWQVSLINFHP